MDYLVFYKELNKEQNLSSSYSFKEFSHHLLLLRNGNSWRSASNLWRSTSNYTRITKYSPQNPASLDETLTLKKSSQPIKKRCSKAHTSKKVFLGPLIWESPNLERAYNFSLKQKMFYEEKVMFNSINCPLLEILLSHNGLANYLGEINQVKIYPSELGQFYVNMSYQKRTIHGSLQWWMVVILTSLALI